MILLGVHVTSEKLNGHVQSIKRSSVIRPLRTFFLIVDSSILSFDVQSKSWSASDNVHFLTG